LNFNQKQNVPYLTKEQYELLEKLPDEIELIMLGCDTEFFQSKQESIEILKKLSNLKKDISVITKLNLPDNFIEEIKKVADIINQNGNLLTFSISLPCYDSAKIWESRAPVPEKRIKTLKSTYSHGLKNLVAIRPLLPSINDEELEKIIFNTHNYCHGYYSGPLYLKSLDLLTEKEKKLCTIEEKMQPHWMPNNNIFYKVEKPGQMEILKKLIEKYNKPLFDGAADGIKYIKQNL